MKSKRPIVITGGHHNSALAIAEKLKQQAVPLLWLGHRYTMIGDKHDSLEYQEVSAAGIPFINLLAGKFHSKTNPLHLIKIPLGFLHAALILIRQRPKLVLAFGGYLSLPVGLVANLLKIPIICFEQTTTIGRANQIVSLKADKNFLAWKSSYKHFPKSTSEIIGLPLRKSLFTAKPKKWFKNNLPVILVTGGKQGAHAINQTVFEIISYLAKKFNIIHLTGFSQKTKDFAKAQQIKQSLPANISSHYQAFKHLSWQKMESALKNSHLIVSRSGAHIIYEMLVLAKPSVLIPLPFSYKNEQQKNANMLTKNTSATLVNQQDLTPESLYQAIVNINKNYSKFLKSAAVSKKTIKTNAADKAVTYILKKYGSQNS